MAACRFLGQCGWASQLGCGPFGEVCGTSNRWFGWYLGRHLNATLRGILLINLSPPPVSILFLTSRALPAGTIAMVEQAALAGRFALRRVRHCMVMVPAGRFIRPPAPRLDGFLRRLGRDQGVAAAADQVLAPGLDQRLAHQEVV